MPAKDEADLLTSRDRAFAGAMQRAREMQGWSQDELATRLRGLGYPWLTRIAVSRIESQRRAARLGEAQAIAECFDLPLSLMTMTTREVSEAVLARPGFVVQRLDVVYDEVRSIGEHVAVIEEERAEISTWASAEDRGGVDPDALRRIDEYLTDSERVLAADVGARLMSQYESGRRSGGAAADAD